MHAGVLSLWCLYHLFTVKEEAIDIQRLYVHSAQHSQVNRKRLEMLNDNKLSVKAVPVSHTLIVQIRVQKEGSDTGTFVYEKW